MAKILLTRGGAGNGIPSFPDIVKRVFYQGERPIMQEWMKDVNPWALQRIAGVLLEAEKRQMWQASEEMKAELQALYLSLEGDLEAQADRA